MKDIPLHGGPAFRREMNKAKILGRIVGVSLGLTLVGISYGITPRDIGERVVDIFSRSEKPENCENVYFGPDGVYNITKDNFGEDSLERIAQFPDDTINPLRGKVGSAIIEGGIVKRIFSNYGCRGEAATPVPADYYFE